MNNDSHRDSQKAVDPHPSDAPWVADVFSSLTTPPIPDELQSPAFLERIYESAAEAEARSLAPVLREGLTSAAAPEDTSWQVDDDVRPGDFAEIRDQVDTVLPGAPSRVPGMLWTRIREDIRAQRAAGAHTPSKSVVRDANASQTVLWMRRAAAVLLVGAGLFGLARILPQTEGFFLPDGTQRQITFVEMTSPSGIDDTILGGGR